MVVGLNEEQLRDKEARRIYGKPYKAFCWRRQKVIDETITFGREDVQDYDDGAHSRIEVPWGLGGYLLCIVAMMV